MNPDVISWVLFPMDGRYRNSFYNIAVLEPFDVSEGDALHRVLFEINYKDNNVIDIQAHLTDHKLVQREAVEKGKIALYLDASKIDFNKNVEVLINSEYIYKDKVHVDLESVVESCALFGDPNRIYPAKIVIDFSNI